MDWQNRLITIYVYICNTFEKDLWTYCQRFTNNNKPEFTDMEALTIFLYGIMEKRFELRVIYNFTRDYQLGWFPHLPSYVAFVNRINRLFDVFPALTQHILDDFAGANIMRHIRLIDSFPVVMASAKRSSKGKAAAGFANKGYLPPKASGITA